ncbi:MAG: carboxypeptidase regulatory-like domain-containing protein [Nitrospirae bacterium]|nr:carboxypeptidase regulatory-like domain-containing protein [Nitrospirota bacterium]MBI3350971.1 carboxypeptidase regulatory-like domain-containing protein [Nitrospirota bacterium]
MRGFGKGIVLTAIAFLFAGAPVFGYEEAPVANGGAVSGKVSFKGAVPAPKTFDLEKFPQPKFCGKVDTDGKGHRLLHEVSVGKDGGLKDVVVAIEKIEKGKPFKFAGTDTTADTCRFLVQGGPSQFVGVVVKKAEFRVKNLDADPSDPKAATGVLHNPHLYEEKGSSNSTIFNLPLPDKGQTINKPVIQRKPESTFHLQCDQHNYMNSYYFPVANPYYAIVGEDGTFTIDGIPPGEYEIHAWHPTLGLQEAHVTVAAGGKASANFSFAAK